jgi:hypothetical protein
LFSLPKNDLLYSVKKLYLCRVLAQKKRKFLEELIAFSKIRCNFAARFVF